VSAREPRQLGLRIPYEPRYGADFIAAPSNEQARLWLKRTAEWPQRRLALWGEPGTGKTHLLHRWAKECDAAEVAGPDLPGSVPDRPFAIDDADACDERALLHLLNSAAESGSPVLLAARPPPARWRVALPDLASRLRAVLAVAIAPADDELLRALLARLLADRQLAVAEPVQEWLLLRLPRTAGAIHEIVARIDAGSLASGGRVTRGLASRAMADLLRERIT
jgi:chromosomal replication initiation ATPase DnaA